MGSDRTKGNGFYLSSEALKQVVQRSYGCPIPENTEGQVGRCFEIPGLEESVCAHGMGMGTERSLMSLPIQTILCFYD